MSRQLLCEHPRIILNPLVPEAINTHRTIVTPTGESRWMSHVSSYKFPRGFFRPQSKGVTLDNIEQYYLLDESTGDTIPLYSLVPCGHCDACTVRAQNSFVQRCILETQSHPDYPWFITLTYDNKHVPRVRIGNKIHYNLCVRDVQLFLKRLRIRLIRNNFEFRLRYTLVGEYGKNTKRPHYHLVIWGISTYTPSDYTLVSAMINSCWSNGFVNTRLIDPAKDDGKSFRYTTKYLQKKRQDKQFPPDILYNNKFQRCFHTASNRGGSIGAHYIDLHADHFRKAQKHAQFFNNFTGLTEDLVWSSYVLNRLYPSYSRLVPSQYRNACKDLNYYCQYSINKHYKNLLDEIREEYPCYLTNYPPLRYDPYFDSIEDTIEYIMKWRKHHKYVSPDIARQKQADRELFIHDNIESLPEKDVGNFIRLCRKMIKRSESLEIF